MLPTVTARTSETSFIVDVGSRVDSTDLLRVQQRSGIDLKFNQAEIGYLAVEGTESAVSSLPYEYAPDVEMQLDQVEAEHTPTEEELAAVADATADVSPDESHIVPPANYALQWDKIDLGLSDAVQHATGDGVTIAVIDSSMAYWHPDLAPNFNEELSMAVVDDGFGVFYPDPNEDHGTHVAGIAAAADGGGAIGMAPEAEIIGIRYFSPDVVGGAAEFTEAVMYGADNADVINTSLGFPPVPRNRENMAFFENYYQAVDAYAAGQDTVWVSSAGNDVTNVDEENVIINPAGLEYNLSVSATGPIGYGYELFEGELLDGMLEGPKTPAFYTDHGKDYVDLSAPGGNADTTMTELLGGIEAYAYDLVFNTVYLEAEGGIAAGYGWKAGTSMSAPNVAGIAALLREQFPQATALQIQRLLKETADPTVGSVVYHGNGYVNPLGALTGAAPAEERPGRGTTEAGRDDRSRDDVGGGGNGGEGGATGRGDRSGGGRSRRGRSR